MEIIKEKQVIKGTACSFARDDPTGAMARSFLMESLQHEFGFPADFQTAGKELRLNFSLA